MKLTTLLIFIGFLQVNATAFGQQHINLTANNTSLEKLFKQLEKQSGYSFFYKAGVLKNMPNVNVEINDASIDEVLQKCFANKPLDYMVVDKSVVIRRKDQPQVIVKATPPYTYVNGKIVDEHDQPLPGVSIKVKGTNIGWVTNTAGVFNALITDPNAILQISFIGYTTQELAVKDLKSAVKIILKEDISKLDEVQVIAYGQTTKRLNTGDQTTVTAKEIQNYPVGNVLSVLQGTVPGMVVSQSTGQAGSSYNVVIRGQNGLTTSTAPLYVIDGIPYTGGSYTSQKSNTIGSNNSGYDALSFINPLDIESVNVLKDADATSIYGSRGANGVILITTKKGKAGDMKVDVNFFSGFSQANTVPQFLNTQQYLQMRKEGKKNDNQAVLSSDYDINGTWDTTRYTNWPKTFLGGTGHSTNAQASISGGNNNVSYMVSGDYRNVSNIQQMIGGNDQTSSLHFNLNSTSNNNRFNMTLTGGYTYDNNSIPNADLSSSASLAPDAPPLYTSDGTLNFQNNTFINPLISKNQIARTTVSNVTGSMVLSYTLLKGLKAQATLGYNKQSLNEFLGNPLSSILPTYIALGSKGSANYTYDNNSFWSIEPQLNYTRQVSKGTLEVTAGASLQKQLLDATQLQVTGYTSDLLINNIAGGSAVTPYGQGYNAYNYKYSAIYGRANYNWLNKYIVNISGRYDGSSKFGQDRQFHVFYAAGAAWLFSSEEFIKQALPFLSFGKLRASYGTTGNDQIPPYLYLENFSAVTSVNPYQGSPGIVPTNLPNPYLSWETTKKANIGLDLQFLKGRIGLEGNYFINRTTDILSATPLSTTTGFTSINQNLPAKVQNKGFDISLNTVNIRSNDFSWSTTLTVSRQRNALLAFPNASASPAIAQQLNQSVNVVFVNRYAGVNPQTGLYQFYDRNGNIISTPSSSGSDQTKLINLNPDYFGTVANTFSYKGFLVSVLFRGIKQLGRSTFGQILSSGLVPGYYSLNYPVDVLNHWQKPGDVAKYGRYASTFGTTVINSLSVNKNTDAYYGDASYIRLQNASVGYQFPSQIASKLHMRSLKIYALGENLATITGYGFSDPETQNYLKMPPLRTITFGIQASL
ncbi:SusC/RagA family TonB-linked outer membrane protein [Mucilaginibacter jinjuensis]|uniref:SusC/RagA family TonB-linked outer membrane protein n=1 Tax=Mucilaginibacter jinjuensis TaxID=1176721 RepID=A0ABY7T4L2_9SPHI|nr:SusC/RagA family TonB-linked outer membrane protein [Mucilaginibacter jinjuensis]WCT10701.1 SusC/RagA family TonB-linked outer membrane protein [Mucilaginibacter jinjuensis]